VKPTKKRILQGQERGDGAHAEGDEKPEFLTTTERRGRHEIEQSQIGPKGEGVGTSESKKRRTRSQKRDLAPRRRDAEGKKNRKFEGGKRKDFFARE